MSKINRFVEISKVDDNDDGTIDVFGVASTEGIDAQGETVTKGCMIGALPDYFRHGGTGPLRAMHQPIAAGYVYKADVNDAGETEICAKVVDPVEVLKVKSGVYKGFSVGGKKLPGGYDPATKTISKMRLTEISLVDRPANPEAVITMFKGEDIDPTATVPADAAAAVEELAELLNKGTIDPAHLLDIAKGAPMLVDEKSIRAAWGKAKAGDDEKLKATIIAAWKKVIDKAGPPEPPAKTEKVDGADDIQKGMYSVGSFAEVLMRINCMASDAASEAQYEGDNSPVPAAMRAWLADGASIFMSYAKEEVDEMIAALPAPAADVEVISMSAKAGDVRKSLDGIGDDLTAFLDIAKAYMPAMDVARIVTADGFPAAVAAVVAQVDGGISKMTTERDDAIAKVAGLAARVAELEAQPAPSRAVLRVVVEKAVDIPTDHTAAPAIDEIEVRKLDGEIDHEATALAQIKKMHQSGGSRLSR